MTVTDTNRSDTNRTETNTGIETRPGAGRDDRRAGTAPRGVLDAVDRLSATIAARATEIESARRVPRDLLGELIRAGCFRMLRPVSHGGIGADLSHGSRMIEALARADASVAWVTMIGGTAWCDIAGLPRATFDDLYAVNPDPIVAGAFNPSGTISPEGDGYRVTGRWSFASGCEHADWVYGNCIEAADDGSHNGSDDGMPRLRLALFSPEQIVIEDTWQVLGLCGTGSHHFHVDDAYVPAERTCAPMMDEPCLDDPIVRVPVPALIALGIGSVAVGTAQGALDDIVALAQQKVPLLSHDPLADNALFQFELANADTELRAARALLRETAASLWATASSSPEPSSPAESGEAFTLADRARARASAVWATRRSVAVVEAAYRSGGGSSVYSTCPLQRRLRDIHALTQHFLVKDDTLTTAGAILAGRDPQVMVF